MMSPQERLLAALRDAGYANPRIVRSVFMGDEVRVEEDLRDADGWPRLWKIAQDLGLARGGGGTFFHQITSEPMDDPAD